LNIFHEYLIQYVAKNIATCKTKYLYNQPKPHFFQKLLWMMTVFVECVRLDLENHSKCSTIQKQHQAKENWENMIQPKNKVNFKFWYICVCKISMVMEQCLISPLWEVPVALSHIFSFTVYARAWWSAFMHLARLSTIFQMYQYFTIYRQYFFLKIEHFSNVPRYRSNIKQKKIEKIWFSQRIKLILNSDTFVYAKFLW
jgi:hypothetical protein